MPYEYQSYNDGRQMLKMNYLRFIYFSRFDSSIIKYTVSIQHSYAISIDTLNMIEKGKT